MPKNALATDKIFIVLILKVSRLKWRLIRLLAHRGSSQLAEKTGKTQRRKALIRQE